MQYLENSNWIILDPLGNIYEIYANINVIPPFSLLNLNHFRIKQADLCLIGTIVKASFTFVIIF